MTAPTVDVNQVKKIRRSLDKIYRKIAIMSIKGGVGKSVITSNLALTLASDNKRVGVLDADVNNPCIPYIFGVEEKAPVKSASRVFPVIGPLNIKIVSTKFFIPDDSITVIRGASKIELIRQFLTDISWGELDYLFIDLPPSIGSEFFSLLQLIPELYGIILVTTPNQLSKNSINKTIRLVNKFNINILGIIENMSGFICPNCKETIIPFGYEKGEKTAKESGVPFLGRIPVIPNTNKKISCSKHNLTIENNAILKDAFLKIAKKI
ncbi:MAG: P-loop NTPase [Candidatus Odinarchaeia archaeon]